GAVLWSIAAGPLVNVALVPVTFGLYALSKRLGWQFDAPDTYHFLYTIAAINLGLLIFNMLPVYPLDGGQILQSLLWFVIGRVRSLVVAAVIGLCGAAGLIALAVYQESIWLGVLAAFVLSRCINGLKYARLLSQLLKMPRHEGFRCPVCGEA